MPDEQKQSWPAQRHVDYLRSELRAIMQITPDFDGEDEDGERHELHQCLETAKRLAHRALFESGKRPLHGVITLSAEEVGKIREALTSAAEDEEFRAQVTHLEQAIRRHAAAALRYRDALSILTRAQKEVQS